MTYEIEVAIQSRRTIAAVAWTTTWERFPGQWRGMLDEVYAYLRQGETAGGCNVMLYRDLPDAGQIAVAVGVEVSGPFAQLGRVRAAELPAGPAAVTTHRGPYGELGAAHRAVVRWSEAEGRELTGERWEVYGDWEEDPSLLETKVFYGLVQGPPHVGA
jgi:effector-binding domain-containing protein